MKTVLAGGLYGIMLSIVGFNFLTWQFWLLLLGTSIVAITFLDNHSCRTKK